MHSFYYAQVDKGIPVGDICMDVSYESNHIKWFNGERWHDIVYKDVSDDGKAIRVETQYKTITFQKLNLETYNEHLRSKIKQNFSSDEELQKYLMKHFHAHD